MRVSIGPAIKVSVAGRAGWLSSDMIAAAASADTEGWQIATMCARGPQLVEKSDEVLGIFVEPEFALVERNVAGVMPVGNVNVVILQQGFDGAAQQRGEVAGHRRDQQHARLFR